MIITRIDGRMRIGLQTDHARITGEFATAWGGGGFAALEPLAAVRLAANLHDEGWADWEAAAQVDRTGRPYEFMNLPTPDHLALYQRGIQIALAAHPYAGLLVSLHGAGLYRRRYGHMGHLTYVDVAPEHREAADAFVAAQEVLQQFLEAQLQPDPAVLWTHYRWLQIWDALSLFLWLFDPAAMQPRLLGRVPLAPGGPEADLWLSGAGPDRFVLDPWPFRAAELHLTCPVRWVTDRAYTTAEFRSALAQSAVQLLRLRLTRE